MSRKLTDEQLKQLNQIMSSLERSQMDTKELLIILKEQIDSIEEIILAILDHQDDDDDDDE